MKTIKKTGIKKRSKSTAKKNVHALTRRWVIIGKKSHWYYPDRFVESYR